MRVILDNIAPHKWIVSDVVDLAKLSNLNRPNLAEQRGVDVGALQTLGVVDSPTMIDIRLE